MLISMQEESCKKKSAHLSPMADHPTSKNFPVTKEIFESEAHSKDEHRLVVD
jgi:hypothetical protein